MLLPTSCNASSDFALQELLKCRFKVATYQKLTGIGFVDII